jgi:hypothetical protein
MIIAAILLPSTTQTEGATLERIKRIDALGALLLGGSVLAFMVPLEIGGQKIPWSHPLVPILAAAGVILSVAFVLVESRWAKEPIFPLRLLRSGDVTKTYLIAFGQAAAQLGVCRPPPCTPDTNRPDDVYRPHLLPSYSACIEYSRRRSFIPRSHRKHGRRHSNRLDHQENWSIQGTHHLLGCFINHELHSDAAALARTDQLAGVTLRLPRVRAPIFWILMLTIQGPGNGHRSKCCLYRSPSFH